MAKMKVHELAKEIGKQSKDVIAFLQDKGIEVKAAQSSLEEDAVSMVRKEFGAAPVTSAGTVPNQNTGKAEDKVCNIRDMTSNCAEWSTEHYTNTTSPCIRRGGNYNSSNITTSSRVCYATTSSETLISFRPLLYLK